MALNALEIAEKIGTINQVNDASLCLMLCNISIGNNVEAQKYAKLYISSRDSMYINDRLKALAEMEALYQTEKKQLQINNLKNEKNLQSETIARKDAENKKQRLLTYTFIVSFIVILLFSIILYRQFSAKKRANSLLSIKNIEITQKSEEITLQRDEIEDHRIKLSNQNSLLSEQKKKITDSINYAKRIQQAVLSIGEFLSNINLEHFVLFKPKDIVSGDFYWGTKINELNIIAVADCTGHGVPGAFMSMLGVSFLNEIVRKNEVIQTNLVLDELRKSIIESLQQKGNDDEQKDGFDIVLCVINSQTNELQFSGAYNPLYIINFEKQLIELIADKQPVGIHDNMTPFDCQSVKLNNGDCIYLSSDGYVDQIGGTNYKKFLSKNLKQLLIANCQLPMQEQKNILEKTLVDWIGDGEQIDDITLLGIRI
ncbi:MAG: hypothetical protein A2046_15905 [Bacteroidetes bacterium GWA2_30_7]|nr:MAG: hypothetical protein A2046_15905 [Bacteroidetes bacterium GWA2_30_7]